MFSLFSETTLLEVSLPIALLVLVVIISVGILFDVIGIAVTCEDIMAYSAMASKKISGAREAIKLVQNAGTVSNICNDVVGDICGIVSGAMGAAISMKIMFSNMSDLALGICISSLTAAFTVGGKALGKRVAMKQSHKIVFSLGKLFSLFSRKEK
ncbi:MAG: hypothetical protein LBS18_04215 [Clostridiales bacterium]|nr:hypothetical protein [Clostridiales bacterium]